MLINLINNIAFLVALVAAGQIVIARFHQNALSRESLLGLLFGGVTLLGMLNPVNFLPGVIFDGRSIVLSVAGVVGGGLTAGIAASMAAIYRYQLGGGGATVGVSVILMSALLGVLARHWWLRGETPPHPTKYLALGVAVQLMQLAAFTQLPDQAGYTFIERAWWVLLLLYPLTTMLLCLIFRDYERRLEDQKALQAAQESMVRERTILRTLIDTLPDLIWLKDPKGVYLACNRRFEQFFGAAEREIVGKTDYDFVDKDLADFFRANDRAAMERDGLLVNEEEIPFASDGHRELLKTTKTPMRTETGDLIGVLGIGHDISEVRRSEHALRESEMKYRILAERSPLAIQVFSPDGSVLRVNSAWEKLWQASLSDLKNYNVLQDQQLEALGILSLLRKVFAGEAVELPEHLYEKASTQPENNGLIRKIWLRTFAYPVTNERGEVLEVVVIQEDISSRKSAEAGLIEYQAELQQAVETRTKELFAAKEAAETANIAKSAFLANMSHEIRTPLNAITGMVHILRRSGITPAQVDKLDKIEAAGNHLLETINAVLDLSKIEAGKFALEIVPVNIGSLLGNIASILSQKAKEKGIVLNTEVLAVSHNLLGDSTRLQQALLNYAANALKFTERGYITLRVKEIGQDEGTVTLRFEVEDTGIGIASETCRKLFGAFEQADNSITRKYGGTGLGLAITKKIAEIMGGEVGVDSVEGQGSTFWFTAVLHKNLLAAGEPAKALAVGAEQAISRNHVGKRILLAEDEPINRSIAQMLLEEVGLFVDLAEDGCEAVGKANAADYDLILMDMLMPHMDGLEATRQIRQLPGCVDIPILAITANAFAEDKTRCFEAGMNDFITKPMTPDILYQTLLKWFEKRRG